MIILCTANIKTTAKLLYITLQFCLYTDVFVYTNILLTLFWLALLHQRQLP